MVAAAALYVLLSTVFDIRFDALAQSNPPQRQPAASTEPWVGGHPTNVILLGAPAAPMAKIVLSLRQGIPGAPVIESLPNTLLQSSKVAVRLHNVIVDGAATGFRVFLNLPDATPQTPFTHEGYVTSAAFFPLSNAQADGQVVGSFVISLKPALAKLAARGGAIEAELLTITVVPIGDGRAKIGFESSALIVN